jgi:serine/threonine-protein kinase RsbW
MPGNCSPNTAAESVELKMDSDPRHLAQMRRTVEQFLRASGFDEKTLGEIGLCLNEALANVIRHAYDGAPGRPIRIVARHTGDAVELSIRDWGNGVNPAQMQEPPYDPLTPGRLGMICLRQLMDQVVFTPQSDGMLLMMTRKKNANQRH